MYCLYIFGYIILCLNKTLPLSPLHRMYFKVRPDSQLAWSLVEQSTDNTVHRPLDLTEDPCEVVDFWGKSKVTTSALWLKLITIELSDGSLVDV